MTERFNWTVVPGGTDLLPVLNTRIPRAARALDALRNVFGMVAVDDFLAVGDGTVDDTTAIMNAEATRTAGQTLRFTPGKTYLVDSAYDGSVGAAKNLLRMLVSGTWDCTGSTFVYGGSANLTTGTDSGALGVINVLSNDTRILGNFQLNGKAQFAVAYKSQTTNHHLDVEISNQGPEPTPSWSGTSHDVSVDIEGVAISGRATNISGFISRPDCPVTDVNDVILTHKPITAVLVGGTVIQLNYTSVAWALSVNMNAALLGVPGIMQTPKKLEGNSHWSDFVATDVGCNQIELYGTVPLAGGSRGLLAGDVVGVSYKWNSIVGFYWRDDSTTNDCPNVRQQAGASAEHGVIAMKGAFLDNEKRLLWGTNIAVDAGTSNVFFVDAISDIAATLSVPTGTPLVPSSGFYVQRARFVIFNKSGGPLSTPVAFAGGTGGYRTSGTVSPGNGLRITVDFTYDATNNLWIEAGRSGAV